jgi:5-methylcytosine-specific restriction enzyme subunit McrC
LKGKLLFNKQVQKNLVHKERFYTRHQVYDRENVYNQILQKALRLIPGITGSPFLKDRVYSLLLAFPELQDIKITEASFEKLVFDRKTAHYREAIEIAAMLLLNYRPDLSGGRNHVLAILFDMNVLWEEYIYRQLMRARSSNWQIKAQNFRRFWHLKDSCKYKTIRPDIIVQDRITGKTLVLDTKWKLPENNIPADVDLKQMFVYNEYWQGYNAMLVYPHAVYTSEPLFFQGFYTPWKEQERVHGCGVVKVSILDLENRKLDATLGKRFVLFLENEMK